MNGNSLVVLLVAICITIVAVIYIQLGNSFVGNNIGEFKHEIQKLLDVQQVQQNAEGILQGDEP